MNAIALINISASLRSKNTSRITLTKIPPRAVYLKESSLTTILNTRTKSASKLINAVRTAPLKDHIKKNKTDVNTG